MDKQNTSKTILTISTGFLVVYFIFHWTAAIGISLAIGIAGVFSPFLSKWIGFGWIKLSYILGLIVPNVLLGVIYFLILFPTALLAKLFTKKDPLMLKKKYSSTFIEVDQEIPRQSYEKPW